MLTGMDVFAVKNGEPMWVGCAETLRDGLELAVRHGDGLYFVFSEQTGHKPFTTWRRGVLPQFRKQTTVKKVSETLDFKGPD